jgi:hypothetical protein
MPTASPDDRQRAEELFGSYGDHDLVAYLTERGWKHTKLFTWVKPTPDHEPTDAERVAIGVLITEWDWDGIEDGLQPE